MLQITNQKQHTFSIKNDNQSATTDFQDFRKNV